MVREVFIDPLKTRFSLDPDKSKFKGGEADIYDIGQGLVLKIFKTPDHPDYEGFPQEQDGAKKRIEEHQHKLPAFPKSLPDRLVVPLGLAYTKSGKIAGYTMPFKSGAEVILSYSKPNFRKSGISDVEVVEALKDMHKTILATHQKQVVFGDFNDLNALVKGREVYFIDMDSSQFVPYLCKVFTQRFVDPLLCDPKKDRPVLVKPHNEMSDWYAYSVILMQTLLCIAGGPYGGVYRPKDPKKLIGHDSRSMSRITVFNPEVIYPVPSKHFNILPDDLLQHFHLVFEKDYRDVFPKKLIENISWTTCTSCGLVHAHGSCPKCVATPPKIVTFISTGTVSGERVFRTDGRIVFPTVQKNQLLWLYHDKRNFRREDESIVSTGNLDPHVTFSIRSEDTIMARGNNVTIHVKGRDNPDLLSVDTVGLVPSIDANEKSIFWSQNGQLRRTEKVYSGFIEIVGDVLANQTMFWVGSNIGFGFYRAGGLSQCFIFNPNMRGINNSLTLKPFRGQLVDSNCFFGKERIWFFVSNNTGGKIMNSCFMIKRDGVVEASAETAADDGSWLGTLHGKCALGDFLLAPTDDGIVRVKALQNRLGVEKEFPDSKRFVHSGRSLFVDKSGLAVVGSREIWRLTIK